MLLTLFLLGLLYVAFVGAMFAAGAAPVDAGGDRRAVAVAALPLGQAGAVGDGRQGGLPEEAPGLHAMIERLCIQADLPKPKIAVADTDVPNAFAMGRSQKNATVCATTGIMQTLSPAELEGVMAHELAHVKNRDVLIMTIASFFASIAAMIIQFGFFFGGGDDDEGAPAFLVVLLASFARLHRLVLPDARPLALPRVLGRPRRGARHRPPQRALLGAHEDLGHDGAGAPAGPAPAGRDERLLHRAHRRQGLAQDALLDAPADGGSASSASGGSSASSRQDRA